MAKRKKRPLANETERFGEQARTCHSDVEGSYTGNPLYGDKPVQDADDL